MKFISNILFKPLFIFILTLNVAQAQLNDFEKYYSCISDDESLKVSVTSVIGMTFISIERINGEEVSDQITIGVATKSKLTDKRLKVKLTVLVSDISTGNQETLKGSLKAKRSSNDEVYRGRFKVSGLVNEKVECSRL